ncbi:MAG: multicopper oxidase [Pseudohongiella sp.]|nr:MAG: multicopper oxidase [Pseudohongiella sp.]
MLCNNFAMLTRRRAIKSLGIGLGASSFALSTWVRSQDSTIAQQPLNIPSLDSGTFSADSSSFDLTLQRGSHSFLSGLSTETLGINGSYLGPTLRFKRNQKVALQVSNQIGEPSSLHWHGFHLPPTQDGGPHQEIAANQVWNPSFDVVQFAGTYWYHSHVMHKSGEQVYRGLAGMIIVDDDEVDLPLPANYGVDDIPIILQDRRFADDGPFVYMNRYEDRVMGMQGDTMLVNGTVNPVLTLGTRLLRLRLLNASNARSYNLGFSDNREFYQIASDGGFLEAPVPLTRLQLAVAERAEILVEFDPGEEVRLVNVALPPAFPEFPGAMSEMMRALNTQAFDILHFRAQDSLQDNGELPAQLVDIFRLPAAAATNTRSFRLGMGNGMRSGEDAGPGRGARNGRGGGFGGGQFSINGRLMAENYINERIEFNTTEIWELTNNSPMMHPFHVHNGQFQLLDRNGEPPPANEMGWKDTVKVGPGELVRIVMRFTDFRDEENPYMYHCHILEHEDQGMMGQFLIV